MLGAARVRGALAAGRILTSSHNTGIAETQPWEGATKGGRRGAARYGTPLLPLLHALPAPSLAALRDAELVLLTEIDATQGIPTQSTYLSLRLPKERGRIGDLCIVLVTFGSYD